MSRIYLDNNATTPLHPLVAQTLADGYGPSYANPASAHAEGRRARWALEQARDSLARQLGAQLDSSAADQLVLTSGGTEANNLALFGLAGPAPARILVSAIEHPSVTGPAAELQRRGYDVQWIRAASAGVIDLDHLRHLLAPGARLVSLMLANNETGAIQPVAEAARLCAAAGALLHTDAVQVVGKRPVDFRHLGAAALSFSAHKFHGPRGIGGLLLRAGVPLAPLWFGGFQQHGLRPGCEDVVLAQAAQRALELWHAEAPSLADQITQLRDRLEGQLAVRAAPVIVNAASASRLPHTSNISFPGVDRQLLWLALDDSGIACSTGSACASGSSEPSPVLLAMGLSDIVVHSSLRFSLSRFTSESDIDSAVDRITLACQRLRDSANRRAPSSPARRSPAKTL